MAAYKNTVNPSLQTHNVDSTLKRRGSGRFQVVSTWNPRAVFVELLLFVEKRQFFNQKKQ